MKLRDLEHAEIRNGNTLLISCVGGPGWSQHCGGLLRVPFAPGIDNAPGAEPDHPGAPVWNRESGETIDDLTITPSGNAFECGHFWIRGGEINP